jgi:thioredoxin-related protein
MKLLGIAKWKWSIVIVCILVGGFLPDTVNAELQSNGLHSQPWIKIQKQFSIMDSLASAKADNKGLVILFEQRGCPYCDRLHTENFSDQDVISYMNKHFYFIQIDLRGDRDVNLLNGKTVSEKIYSRSLAVTNTPTTLFLTDAEKERFRMPGFIEAPIYKAEFQYVVENGPESGIGFIPWVKDLIRRSRRR